MSLIVFFLVSSSITNLTKTLTTTIIVTRLDGQGAKCYL